MSIQAKSARRRARAMLCTAAMIALGAKSGQAAAQTIASFTQPGNGSAGLSNYYVGQSFTLNPGVTGTFNDVSFRFTNFDGSITRAASGTLSIFTSAQSSPSAAATATTNLVGRSSSVDANGVFYFSLPTGLTNGVTYYAYTSNTLPVLSRGSGYPGGFAYYTTNPNGAFGGGTLSSYFEVAATPEPAAWAMMIGGFALAGGVARRRRHLTARA